MKPESVTVTPIIFA